MSTFVSYMFRLLPNDTYPSVTTYSGCEGKREVSWGDFSRTVFLDPNNIQKILDVINTENETLSNAFQGWKQCSVIVITNALEMIKGSVCWYPFPSWSDTTDMGFNWRRGECIEYRLPNNSHFEIECRDRNFDIRDDLSECFDPISNVTAHTYSYSTPYVLNGVCNRAFDAINRGLQTAMYTANEQLNNIFNNDWMNKIENFRSSVECGSTDIPIGVVSKDSDSALSTGAIITISLLSAAILGMGTIGAFFYFRNKKKASQIQYEEILSEDS